MALNGRMLFVDDSTRRIHSALKKYADLYDVTICANVPEALRYLSSREWDMVSLDFDLNGQDFQDPDEKTCGMEIVRYLTKTSWPADRHMPKFIIHSSNALGARLMSQGLRKLGFEVWEERYQYE